VIFKMLLILLSFFMLLRDLNARNGVVENLKGDALEMTSRSYSFVRSTEELWGCYVYVMRVAKCWTYQKLWF